MNNNDCRREEFEKRRKYKGTISMCKGYDCPVFMNCLLEIKKLQEENKQLKDNWCKLKEIAKSQSSLKKKCHNGELWFEVDDLLDKMQELEGSDE